MKYLYDKLVEYKKEDIYPMHMPGHKRNTSLMSMVNPYEIDITEIDGFDNLHAAEDILLENMQQAAKIYGAKYTHYLINGSTSGLLVAIAACTNKGDKVLIARNCHKAVYHGVFLNELHPVYIYPEVEENYGIHKGITAKQVEKQLLENPDVSMVLITSPTYEGLVSEVDKIAKLVHSYGIPLVVDEAHGAHFGFSEGFPKSSVTQGADLVIHSVHKTLPAFTQTALLHINDQYVDYVKVKRYLAIYQTSSPSYVLMSGISNCMRLLEEHGEELFSQFSKNLEWFYKECNKLNYLKVFHPTNEMEFDLSKVIIFTHYTNLSGPELHQILLNQYKIQCEMVSKNYVLCMTSIADTKDGFRRLLDALVAIDAMYENRQEEDRTPSLYVDNMQLVLTPAQAYNREQEAVILSKAQGRIAGEFVYLYPPGIPLIVPGERITDKIIEKIESYKKANLNIQGMKDGKGKTIKVVLS